MKDNLKKCILVVDDEAIILRVLLHHLTRFIPPEVEIVAAMSGEEAISRTQTILQEGGTITCVISDYLMHPMRGSELLIKLNESIPCSKKILLTGHADLDAVSEVLKQIHLFRYISKPWEPSDLEMTVSEAIRMFDFELELRNRNKELENIQISLEEKVVERTKELEQRNLELQQGLQYARYIQECLLTDTSEFGAHLKNFHIFNKPLGEVSGDFAWCRAIEDKLILAVGDSTGHGLAGALITVMVSDILSEKTAKGHLSGSLRDIISQALTTLRSRIQRNVIYGEHAPGIDIAIVLIEKDSAEMEWASLNSNLLLVDANNQVEVLCKTHGFLHLPNFEDKILHGRTNIRDKKVVMLTDGIYDQIGGERNKRLKLSGLIQKIEQGEIFNANNCTIEQSLAAWQGDNEPTDDALWLCFRV
jgi:CheY-like chemotaxis protein